jgi:hypothetical protein
MDDPAKPLRQNVQEIERKVDKAGELALRFEHPDTCECQIHYQLPM